MGHTYPPMKIDGKWHDYEEIVKRPDCGPYDADGIERARAFLQKHGENMVVGAVNLYRLIVTADSLRSRLAAAEAAVAVRDALLNEAGYTILALRKACNPHYMALEPGCIENRIDTTLRGDATSAKEAPRG